ncbi:MAG: polysaccharide deacetylase family protein [Lautropia sp.]
MPFKQNYTVSDERSQTDVRWPDGAACAVTFVIDPSPPCPPGGIGPKELQSDEAHYGLQVALPRLLEVLDRRGVHATFPVPAILAETAPGIVRDLVARGHEVAAHGWMREDVAGQQRHEEAWRIERTTQVLADVTGTRPVGWYSLPRQSDRFPGGAVTASTIDLLIEHGYGYFGNGMADDIPHYWVADFEAGRTLLTMPYSYHFDDQYFIEFPAVFKGGNNLERSASLLANWKAEFDAMAGTGGGLRFGRSLTCVVHCWLSGWGQRLAIFDEMLTHVQAGSSAWIPTARACADYWKQAYPPGKALHLAPSIWQQHPGSIG